MIILNQHRYRRHVAELQHSSCTYFPRAKVLEWDVANDGSSDVRGLTPYKSDDKTLVFSGFFSDRDQLVNCRIPSIFPK